MMKTNFSNFLKHNNSVSIMNKLTIHVLFLCNERFKLLSLSIYFSVGNNRVLYNYKTNYIETNCMISKINKKLKYIKTIKIWHKEYKKWELRTDVA